MSTGRRGFTLIELLVVIAIIGILAAIIFPVFGKAKEKAAETQCIANLRQIALAVQMYADDQGNIYPDGKGVWDVLNIGGKVLVCPKKASEALTYGYNGWLSGLNTAQIATPEETIVAGDSMNKAVTLNTEWEARHGGKVQYAYVDGHVAKLGATLPTVPTVEVFSGITTGLLNGKANWIWDGGQVSYGDVAGETLALEGPAVGAPAGSRTVHYRGAGNTAPGYDVTNLLPTGDISAWSLTYYQKILNSSPIDSGTFLVTGVGASSTVGTLYGTMPGWLVAVHRHDDFLFHTAYSYMPRPADSHQLDLYDNMLFNHTNLYGSYDWVTGAGLPNAASTALQNARAAYFAKWVPIKVLVTGKLYAAGSVDPIASGTTAGKGEWNGLATCDMGNGDVVKSFDTYGAQELADSFEKPAGGANEGSLVAYAVHNNAQWNAPRCLTFDMNAAGGADVYFANIALGYYMRNENRK